MKNLKLHICSEPASCRKTVEDIKDNDLVKNLKRVLLQFSRVFKETCIQICVNHTRKTENENWSPNSLNLFQLIQTFLRTFQGTSACYTRFLRCFF